MKSSTLAQRQPERRGSTLRKTIKPISFDFGPLGSLEEIDIVIRNAGHPTFNTRCRELHSERTPRFRAVTYNAQGEVVSGQVLMFKGANSYKTVRQ